MSAFSFVKYLLYSWFNFLVQVEVQFLLFISKIIITTSEMPYIQASFASLFILHIISILFFNSLASSCLLIYIIICSRLYWKGNSWTQDFQDKSMCSEHPMPLSLKLTKLTLIWGSEFFPRNWSTQSESLLFFFSLASQQRQKKTETPWLCLSTIDLP